MLELLRQSALALNPIPSGLFHPRLFNICSHFSVSLQVSNYLSFTRDDSDEEKRAELASVVAIGDVLFVKVTLI